MSSSETQVADNTVIDDTAKESTWFNTLFFSWCFIFVGVFFAPIGYGALLFGYPSYYYNTLIDLNLLPPNVQGYKLFFN